MRGAAAAVVAAIALAGCGSGGDQREPGPASTAAATRAGRTARCAVLVRRAARLRAGRVPARHAEGRVALRLRVVLPDGGRRRHRDRQRDGGRRGRAPGRRADRPRRPRLARARPERRRRAAGDAGRARPAGRVRAGRRHDDGGGLGPHDLPRHGRRAVARPRAVHRPSATSRPTPSGRPATRSRAPCSSPRHRRRPPPVRRRRSRTAPRTRSPCRPASGRRPGRHRGAARRRAGDRSWPGRGRTACWCSRPTRGTRSTADRHGRRSATSSRRSCRARPLGQGTAARSRGGPACDAVRRVHRHRGPAGARPRGGRVRPRPRHPPDGGAVLLDRGPTRRRRRGLRGRAEHPGADVGDGRRSSS